MEESPKAPTQTYRSTASNNWRVRDDTPRADAQPRFQRGSSDRQANSNPPPDAAPGTRLYVGNLLYSAQGQDVEQLFTDNGFSIAQINMSTDPFTGRNPSYCFVDLETADDASRAMAELNGKEVLGRPVKINPGVAKRSFGAGGPQTRVKSYERGWSRDGSGQGMSLPAGNDSYKPTFDRWSRTDAPNHWNNTSEQGRRLYVGGLPRMEPQNAVDAEMQKLFEGFELQAVSKIISPHASKASEPGNHYYLFVDLPSSEDVDAAIEKFNGKESPWGGELRVSRARDNRERKVNREQYGGNGGGEGGGGGGRGYSKPGGSVGRWGADAKEE